MKKFISENWYKAIKALSFLILACGFFIYSVQGNKAYGNPKKPVNDYKTCVGGIYDGGHVWVIWSDGTISISPF
jgi:hypothetical protein